MDNIQLDAEVLLSTANIVSSYTRKQKQVMIDYLSNITSLISDWQDDDTFGPLITEINKLRKEVVEIMDTIDMRYVSYFRTKAEQIEQRPVYNKQSYSQQNSSSQTSLYTHNATREITTMSRSPLSVMSLNNEMCKYDRVGDRTDYVKISSNGRRIEELEHVGTFLSPVNGKEIICKNIAWRSIGISEANAYNVCGADFYYKDDGTFCGSYTGANWQDIFNNNYSDTKKFRK